jgi:Uma2 family endonuclease
MTDRAKNGAVYADVISAPEDQLAEIVEGSLYLSPRPSLRHTKAASVLGADILDAFHRGRRGPGGWLILFEPELHLFGDVLVPDIAGWRTERLPEHLDGTGMEIAPDWLCEVLSPSTEQFDRKQKLPRYALAGVGYIWLIDPLAKRLDVFCRHELDWARIETTTGGAIVSAPPFESVPIELAPLWV